MSDAGKWPFEDEEHGAAARKSNRFVDSAQARLAGAASVRRSWRHDRLIVGGKAHVKKHGLS
jgi:hypothetical protein